MDFNKILDFFAGIAASEGAEAKLEGAIGFADAALDAKVIDTWVTDKTLVNTTNKLDDAAKHTFDIATRDFYVKKNPLADNPVD